MYEFENGVYSEPLAPVLACALGLVGRGLELAEGDLEAVTDGFLVLDVTDKPDRKVAGFLGFASKRLYSLESGLGCSLGFEMDITRRRRRWWRLD